MPTDKKQEGLLTSWKEIALYLDCYERTCRRWERTLGLPIHRIEGAARSRIFAYKDELDQWRSDKLKNGTTSNSNPHITIRRLNWHNGYLFVLIIPILILLAAFSNKIIYSRQPTDFSIVKSNLIIYNEKGKELWRYDTGKENLCSESEYRTRFQQKILGPDGHAGFPYLIFKDLNRDGKNEILFSIQTEDEIGEGDLFCFSSNGKILWKYKSGREIQYGNYTNPSEFRINALVILDLENNSDYKIVVVSFQRYQFPCQLTILDIKGKTLGEYWNSGYLNDLACLDINQDGKKEILLAGINNEYKKGCIAVFDPFRVSGGSPQIEDDYKCKELGRGTEMYYVLLPRTDADLATNYSVESIKIIENHPNRRFSVRTWLSQIEFLFAYDMGVKQVLSSHSFEQMHKTFLQQGKIKSILNEDYMRNLKKGILYWDGTNWVSSPTMNLNWKDAAKKSDANRGL